MNIDELRQILEMVRDHPLVEFEFDREGLRLRIRKASPPAAAGVTVPHATPAVPHVPQPASGPGLAAFHPQAAPTVGGEMSADGLELAVVKSPIVGTFYSTASPGGPPFVDVGTVVKRGQVVCIIEAMKLMNEIECEYEGEIVRVYVENGQPVQYGERLFAIRAK